MIKINGVSQVEGNDNRFIESCFRILQLQNVQLPASFDTPAEGARVINQVIASRGVDPKEKEQMVQSLITEAKQALLFLGELSWLQDDERACYFFWASIYLDKYNSTPNHPTITSLVQQPQNAPLYSQLGLKSNPSNSIERFNEVIKYFDRVRQPKK
ncbi:hypothetical protein [Pseudoalteromonas sp. SWXJZ10B]|uniref:hypothetical protein n=1 Tax=Pseudoalteromonas sp. SWXJZ10B TaxID=2792063 RepID=UPI0018CF8BDA|nr:hypothetical protein [Pseudoalteromonas sp. SWXJZ10B]MBH0043741.1 hypothetical protein [Pseudoalteromonas sp. SWXJZ10B]